MNRTILVKSRTYKKIRDELVSLLETARRSSARAINAVMTATYWEIGRRIVILEQKNATHRGEYYGKEIVERLSRDLTKQFGRGFGRRNIYQMRAFYLAFPKIVQTPSAQSQSIGRSFPLPWSHYVRLLSVEDKAGREFYHKEALRGGWSFRQLDRQISSLFYERIAMSRNKGKMLAATLSRKGDSPSAEEEIKDPFVLEFLDLKDEYSETDLEDGLIQKLEGFLLELGEDFAFVGRQKRLRIGDEWYRVDLLFFHRRLRCLIIIDLKLGKFTHADAGQMHLYLNYAREHWMCPGENPPVGLILSAQKNDMVAKYALEGLPNKVLAAQYRLTLPKERVIVSALVKNKS